MSLRHLWTGSLRRQLVVGIALVHAVMMTALVADLVHRQGVFLDESVEKQATGAAEVLAASSTSWVLANDVEGLNEVLGGLQNYPGFREAMVLSPDLKVLGHSVRAHVGQFLNDTVSERLKQAPFVTHTLQRDGEVMDAVAPVLGAGGRLLGWARVRLSVESAHREVAEARRSGLWYALGAVVLGIAFALVMASGLTRDLRRLVAVADTVRRGVRHRSTVRRDDELGRLSDELNTMLDVLEASSNAKDELRRAIEERALLQEQLTQSQKMDALGKMAGGVAHDFNNLLMAINAHVELARGETGEQQVRDDLQQALTAGARARDLVAQVLAFGRNTVTSRTSVNLNLLAGDVVKLVSAMGPAVQVTARLGEAAQWTHGGATDLHRALLNLCTNARDAVTVTAGPAGVAEPPTVTVEVRRRHATGVCASCHQPVDVDAVEVSVEDNGPGVDPGVVQHIFEPFFTTRRGAGGTGLGLAMVHGVAHSHEGHLLLSTRPGATRFSMLLQPTEAPAPEPVAAAKASLSCSGRLLVVDDEPLVAKALGRLLTRAGFEVVIELDPQAALDRATNEAFVAMVTDLSMPSMTGVELATALRARGRTLPIVVCTGNDSALQPSAAVDAVANKPVELDALVKVLSELIRRSC